MYILAFNSCQHHTFIVHFIPEEGAAIDAVLIVSCLQNTPYRLHKYMFGRGGEQDCFTAENLLCNFSRMAGLSLLAGAHGSRHISFWGVISFVFTVQECIPGELNLWDGVRSSDARWNWIFEKIGTGLFLMDPIDAIDVSR